MWQHNNNNNNDANRHNFNSILETLTDAGGE